MKPDFDGERIEQRVMEEILRINDPEKRTQHTDEYRKRTRAAQKLMLGALELRMAHGRCPDGRIEQLVKQTYALARDLYDYDPSGD